MSPDGLDEESPSKKAKQAGAYYTQGLIIGGESLKTQLVAAYTALGSIACDSAAEMMSTISSIVQDDSIDWTPTIAPVFDTSQLQNGSEMLNDTFGSSALNMAANTSLSVNSSSQVTLAAQVQSLSDQVKKLADTDYSKKSVSTGMNVTSFFV